MLSAIFSTRRSEDMNAVSAALQRLSFLLQTLYDRNLFEDSRRKTVRALNWNTAWDIDLFSENSSANSNSFTSACYLILSAVKSASAKNSNHSS